jgi:hypothetical protein
VLLCVAAALALIAWRSGPTIQTQQLAIEGPPGHFVTVARGLSTETPAAALERLPAHAAPKIQLDTLKIDYGVEDGKVVATVYALTLPHEDPRRYDDAHKKLLGVHKARIGQRFELKELEEIGYRPLMFRVVAPQPPALPHLELISKAPSVQLSLARDGRASLVVAMKNVSNRNVLAYAFSAGNGSISRESLSTGVPIITAGASRTMPLDDPSPLVLVAAIFEDGGHEGDASAAAKLYGHWLGYLTQARRADPLIRGIVADPALNEEGKIAHIRTALLALPKQPDEAMIRTAKAAFPDCELPQLKRDLTNGLDLGLSGIWSSLYGFEHQSATYPRPATHPPIARWWPSTMEASGLVPRQSGGQTADANGR